MNVSWQDIIKRIRNGEMGGIYLFYGPEAAVMAETMDALYSRYLPAGLEELNLNVLESPGVDYIHGAAQTYPIMAEKRIVVARDLPVLTQAKPKDEDSETEKLSALIKDPPQHSIIVFTARSSPDKRKKAYKLFEKGAVIAVFDRLTENELAKRIIDKAKSFSAGINESNAYYLISIAGNDLTVLMNETEKLASRVGEGGKITRSVIDEMITPSPEITVFRAIDDLFSGNAGRSYELLNGLMKNGESPSGIIAMLERQLRILYHVKLMTGKGMTPDQMEKMLEIRDFMVKNALRQSRRLPEDKLERAYRYAALMDYSFKNGKIKEDEALSRIMAELTDLTSR